MRVFICQSEHEPFIVVLVECCRITNILLPAFLFPPTRIAYFDDNVPLQERQHPFLPLPQLKSPVAIAMQCGLSRQPLWTNVNQWLHFLLDQCWSLVPLLQIHRWHGFSDNFRSFLLPLTINDKLQYTLESKHCGGVSIAYHSASGRT